VAVETGILYKVNVLIYGTSLNYGGWFFFSLQAIQQNWLLAIAQNWVKG